MRHWILNGSSSNRLECLYRTLQPWHGLCLLYVTASRLNKKHSYIHTNRNSNGQNTTIRVCFMELPFFIHLLQKAQQCCQYYLVGFEVLMVVSTKMAVFWIVAPCSLVEVYQHFRGPCCLHRQGNLITARSSEILVNFYQTTLRYNPEDSLLNII
jgi:hypothetical protein